MTTDLGHNAGTPGAETRAAQGPQEGAASLPAVAPPGWPRLMSLELAAKYVGLSGWTLREYINSGDLRVIRPARPDTARAHGIRGGKRTRRTVASDAIRRLLIDRSDLDALVDRWKRGDL